jgi:hypothetical protein
MIDKQFCIHCTVKKDKIFTRYVGTKRIYADASGAEWSGSRCPECYKKYKLEYDAKRRKKLGHDAIGTIRICEECSAQFKIVNGSTKLCSNCRGNYKD